MNSFPEEYKEGRIYTSDGTCAVSFRQQWIDGIYENTDAAKIAIDMVASGREETLKRLWAEREAKTAITTGMLSEVNQ